VRFAFSIVTVGLIGLHYVYYFIEDVERKWILVIFRYESVLTRTSAILTERMSKSKLSTYNIKNVNSSG
jgi:hypothetical protein